MTTLARTVIVAAVALWMLVTATPDLMRIVQPVVDVGLSVDFDGVVTAVDAGSPAAAAAIVPGDRIVAPLPPGLFRQPLPPLSFRLLHGGVTRPVVLVPRAYSLSRPRKLLVLALYASYTIFLVVGSTVLLMRPNAMTWAFYLYCVARRYGDLGFYWPGSNGFFWANVLVLAGVGGMSCLLVTIFALRFPSNRLNGWRRIVNRIALLLLAPFAFAWPYVIVRMNFFGEPSQSLADLLVRVTSIVYLGATAIFFATFLRSHGAERQRLRWVLIFPLVLVLRIVAIFQGNGLLPYSLPEWFPRAITVLAVVAPLAVAYAIVRQRVFDIEFAISRALVYAAITTLIGGSFLLLDWFMSKQFVETRFTLTAEIILALAIGSWLNMLHRNVDRFVDSTFFRQRHLAEERLKKAAAAVVRAESHDVVDRFLVHEPVRALDLTSAALFRRSDASSHFARSVAEGLHTGSQELTADDPLVLHLLAEEGPVRLADVTWASDERPTHLGDAVLAMPVLLRDELVSIALYGPHRNGADIDPDEVRGIALLVEKAGAAYDHIEAHTLREQVASLIRERDAARQEISVLRAASS